MSTQAPFIINPELTAVSLAYKNGLMIAESVLPRVPVGTQDFKYTVHTKDEPFNLPETQVGRTGKVGEAEFTATDATASCVDQAIKGNVPLQDIENAKNNNFSPMGRMTEGLSEIIMLRREKRTADIAFAAATYPVGNKQTLSGTSQWSDHTDSDPLGDILTAMDATWITPNKLIINRAVWKALRTHPDIIKATQGNSGDTGIAARQAVAEMLELQEIIIGESKINSANKGQTSSLTELWGKHAALLYIDPAVAPRNGVSFGYTATFGTKETYSKFDDEIGMRGANVVKTGESLIELITASDCGYFFENAVA